MRAAEPVSLGSSELHHHPQMAPSMHHRMILRARPEMRRPLSITGVAVMRLEVDPGRPTVAHDHDVLELAFIESGSLEQCIGERSFTCQAGSLLIMPTGCRHAYRGGSRGAVLWNILIDQGNLVQPDLPSPLRGYLPRIFPAPGTAPSLVSDLSLQPFLSVIAEEQGNGNTGWVQVVAAHIRVIAIAIARAMAQQCPTPEQVGDSRLDALCQEIEDSPARPWPVTELAAKSGLGRTGLTRAFLRLKQCSPARYVRLARLRSARAMIADGLPIMQAAKACGYVSTAALTHAARRTTDSTPGSWRGVGK